MTVKSNVTLQKRPTDSLINFKDTFLGEFFEQFLKSFDVRENNFCWDSCDRSGLFGCFIEAC